MIPGFLITIATFPGVIFHELAHALFCRLFGIKIYQIKYFQISVGRGQPAGYVVHAPAAHAWQNVLVSVGPFFVNTICGAIIAAPGGVSILRFHGSNPIDYFLCWLGISIAMHSFPSTGDAASIWKAIHRPSVPGWTKMIGIPLIGLIYIGAIGSFFWFDLIYGVAVAGLLPNLLVKLFV